MHVYYLCLVSSDDVWQTFEHSRHIHSGDDDDDDDEAFDDEGEEEDEDVWQTFEHGRHISPPSSFATKSVDQFLSPEFSFSSQFHQHMDSEGCVSDAGIIR